MPRRRPRCTRLRFVRGFCIQCLCWLLFGSELVEAEREGGGDALENRFRELLIALVCLVLVLVFLFDASVACMVACV